MDNKNTIEKVHDNLRDDYLVVKDNLLNDASLCSEMTYTAYKLILVSLSKISPLSNELDYIYFKVKDFCDLMGIKGKSMYYTIKNLGKKLQSYTLLIEDKTNGNWRVFSWFHEILYIDGLIKLKFHKNLEKFILTIRKDGGYTKYFIKNIIPLKSLYSIRMYELLKQYQQAGIRKIELEDLKIKIAAVKKSHRKMNFFRNYVLIPAINEINICTDLKVNYKEIKDGQKVTHLEFYIQKKNKIASEYKTLNKENLILKIQSEILNISGHIFQAKYMNNLHRIILLEFYRQLISKNFNKKLIHKPENFFISVLDKIKKEEEPHIDTTLEKFKDF